MFPFARFPGVDILLGPEMRSTGEVMGLDYDFALAFAKSQLGAGVDLPRSGTLFVSVRDDDKPGVLPAVKRLADLGFKVLATCGTARFLAEHGVTAEKINKVLEGRPHIEDAIRNRQVQIVFNTTDGQKAVSDSKSLRRATLMQKVPYYTTMSGAAAVAEAIAALKAGSLEVQAAAGLFCRGLRKGQEQMSPAVGSLRMRFALYVDVPALRRIVAFPTPPRRPIRCRTASASRHGHEGAAWRIVREVPA